MRKVFDSYGEYYDIIYADKNYEEECDFLEEAFKKFSISKPKTILDVGCGTGGHAFEMAKRGYSISGIDASPTMIKIANKKKTGPNTVFYVKDVRSLRLNRRFDACISMFAVMDYITRNEDIGIALTNIRKHLKENSLFIFDFWYGPTVLRKQPSFRVKTMKKEDIKVIRTAEPKLDILHHICTVTYGLLIIENNVVVGELKEKHIVRYFFPEEIRHYLVENGFQFLRICSFPSLKAEVGEEDWTVAVIARAA